MDHLKLRKPWQSLTVLTPNARNPISICTSLVMFFHRKLKGRIVSMEVHTMPWSGKCVWFWVILAFYFITNNIYSHECPTSDLRSSYNIQKLLWTKQALPMPKRCWWSRPNNMVVELYSNGIARVPTVGDLTIVVVATNHLYPSVAYICMYVYICMYICSPRNSCFKIPTSKPHPRVCQCSTRCGQKRGAF